MTGWRRRAAVLAAVTALLSACATRPPAGDVIAGKLALKVDAVADRPARTLSSAFELRGDGERGELQLVSPLGSIVALARWAPGSARLETAEGQHDFTDLDALSRDALGEALPLRALPSWLRGRPWPGAPSTISAEGFEQAGWRVGLARFADGALEIVRTAPPAVVLRVRLDNGA